MPPKRNDAFELVYQIFPDRWRDARPDLTPGPGEWSWRGRPIEVSKNKNRLTRSPNNQYTFFGGDLEGVRLSLDYLQDLGATAVYLNPIFAARSTHRYDTVDYFRIDPALGSRADFEALAADLHARGMKLILDGVFNHTSLDHPWHTDPKKRRRYYVMRDEERAMTWFGRGALPKLDTQKKLVQETILKVVDAWPEVDVWRLDAAHLLPHAFLRRLRERIAPRGIVIEDWHFGRHYHDKGLADGVTNFLFKDAMTTFFLEDASPETLLDRLSHWIAQYPPGFAAQSWNFLDNHDTPRFRTTTSRERMMRAMVLLFTLPGTPLLYHGIEVGLEGADGNASRAPMPWSPKRWDGEVLEHARRLIALRREHPALRSGKFRPLFADNRSRTLAFERIGRGERIVVALNDGYRPCRVQAGDASFRLKPGEWRIKIG